MLLTFYKSKTFENLFPKQIPVIRNMLFAKSENLLFFRNYIFVLFIYFLVLINNSKFHINIIKYTYCTTNRHQSQYVLIS